MKIVWWIANVFWGIAFIALSIMNWLFEPLEVSGVMKTLGFGTKVSTFMLLIVGLLIVIIIQLAVLYNINKKDKEKQSSRV